MKNNYFVAHDPIGGKNNIRGFHITENNIQIVEKYSVSWVAKIKNLISFKRSIYIIYKAYSNQPYYNETTKKFVTPKKSVLKTMQILWKILTGFR